MEQVTAKQLIAKCEQAARQISGGELNKDALIGALSAQVSMLVAQFSAPSIQPGEHETTLPFGQATALARYAYEQGEARTHSHPGAPSAVHLTGLFIGSADILDALTGSQIDAIEQGILQEHEFGMPLIERKAA